MSDASNSAESGLASRNNSGSTSTSRNNNFYGNQTYPDTCKSELGKFKLHAPTDEARATDEFDKSSDTILDYVAAKTIEFKHGRFLLEGFQNGVMPLVVRA